MASNKDIQKELGLKLSKSRELSYEWRTRKPEKRDFGIEHCNITEIHKRKCAFENERDRRVRKMVPPPSKPGSIPFGWEGFSMIALMIIMIVYYVISGQPNTTVLFCMAGVSIFIIAMYIKRKMKTEREYAQRKKEFEEEKLKLSRKPFPDEETYDAIVEYARALADYEAWEERRKESFWKDAPQIEVRDSLYSIYSMLGAEPDDSYDTYVDFIADEEDGRKAIGCVGGKKLNLQFLESFIYEMDDSNLKKGVLYAFSSIDNQAKKKLETRDIEVRGIDYVMDLVRELDRAE